ncbi:MAG: dienelactone hydrolase-like enzyme [Phycisphaerales bacterium]|nr:dienelactone hydrolase-like enzyme [Phycisphaerales bacterium]
MASMIHASGYTAVQVPVDDVLLDGDLVVPANAFGVVLFAHGSGSSRHSRRNQFVARVLQGAGMATLLMDLLTREEEAIDIETAHLRFDIDMLARRLVEASRFVVNHPRTLNLPVGLFGASTGGAAALVAAAHAPHQVAAVVSRGGRPDLAGDALPLVKAPTLLIVGGEDGVVIDLNRQAYAQLRCEKRLEIVPGAGHLFEEPGALEQVAVLAREWFEVHLRSGKGGVMFSDAGVIDGHEERRLTR